MMTPAGGLVNGARRAGNGARHAARPAYGIGWTETQRPSQAIRIRA